MASIFIDICKFCGTYWINNPTKIRKTLICLKSVAKKDRYQLINKPSCENVRLAFKDFLHKKHSPIAILKLKNNMNYSQDGRLLWRKLWKGIISFSSKSRAILSGIMNNTASHFWQKWHYLGGGKSFPWRRGNCLLDI